MFVGPIWSSVYVVINGSFVRETRFVKYHPQCDSLFQWCQMFMARTHAILGTAARDGPLLNFCKLGHLGIMAVPSKGSGLEDTDVNGLLDLLQKMTEDPRLPLTLASTPVWDDLHRLRDEVVDICERNSKNDKANMQAVLQCRTLKLDKFGSRSHSKFCKILTLPLCSEWQNTFKNALWDFSHDFLRVANFFDLFFRRLYPNSGSEAVFSVL